MENLELESVPMTAAKGVLSKAVRVLLATTILGSVAAYAAIRVEPQLVDYLSFIPEIGTKANHCSTNACGSCGLEGSGIAACERDLGCCSTEGEACDPPSVGVLTEEPNSEKAVSASAEDPVEAIGTAE
jgi:hypothetical protein